jgi:hypothetical protein
LNKVGYLFLLLILILQSGAMLLIFKAQQSYVRFEMNEKLESNHESCELLILTLKEFKKSRIDTKEIIWDGKLYDIRSAVVSGNIVRLEVINDTEEEHVLERIKYLVQNASLPDNPLPKQLYQLITMVYLQPYSVNLNLTNTFLQNFFQPFLKNISSGEIDTSTPPPKQV